MRTTLLASRYAGALRAAVTDPAQLEHAAQALDAIHSLYENEASFRHSLGNPTLDLAIRRQILDAAVKACETPESVAHLLGVLLQRNRITLLPAVVAQFQSQVDNWLNRVEVTVVTAVPMTNELKERVIKSLERFSGKSVRMMCKVDLNIVGGLMVYMWGVFFDFSLRARLERLKQQLLKEETLTYEH